MKPTLHYIHDPLCGWCYGAAPLVSAAREFVSIVSHGGAMMTDIRRRYGSQEFRNQIAPHAVRIESLTGQRFSERYIDDLLCDGNSIFDSEPPIAAMLAVDSLANASTAARASGKADSNGDTNQSAVITGLDLLARIQSAQYIEGRCVGELDVLTELAVEAGLPRDGFIESYQSVAGAVTAEHIDASRALLRRVGGHGFPTFAWEVQGRYEVLDIGPWLGKVDTWRVWLARHTNGLRTETAGRGC
ncbi:DsbA family protein [Paraburkholderia sp.]|uniref:DsbA family protein n=1 Tax=Paraburkholderia sp. TaxID=1926495 RepID=UPI003C7EA002